MGRADMTDLVIGAEDAGRCVRMTAGGRLTIRLPENPSTGYMWTVSGDTPLPLIDHPFHGGNAAAGAAGERLLVFDVSVETTGRLTLLRKRPWLGDESADATYEVDLVVTGPA
jgi:predicted secreted protein